MDFIRSRVKVCVSLEGKIFINQCNYVFSPFKKFSGDFFGGNMKHDVLAGESCFPINAIIARNHTLYSSKLKGT